MSTYNSAIVERARRLHAATWSIEGTRRQLAHEFELARPPAWVTVKEWVDPRYRERARARCRINQRQYSQRQGAKHRQPSPELRMGRLKALRAAGVSYNAIARVAGVWWGEALTEKQVRWALGAET